MVFFRFVTIMRWHACSLRNAFPLRRFFLTPRPRRYIFPRASAPLLESIRRDPTSSPLIPLLALLNSPFPLPPGVSTWSTRGQDVNGRMVFPPFTARGRKLVGALEREDVGGVPLHHLASKSRRGQKGQSFPCYQADNSRVILAFDRTPARGPLSQRDRPLPREECNEPRLMRHLRLAESFCEFQVFVETCHGFPRSFPYNIPPLYTTFFYPFL